MKEFNQVEGGINTSGGGQQSQGDGNTGTLIAAGVVGTALAPEEAIVGGFILTGIVLYKAADDLNKSINSLFEKIGGKDCSTSRGVPWVPPVYNKPATQNRFPNNNPNVNKWIKYTLRGAGGACLVKGVYENMKPNIPASNGLTTYPSSIPVVSPIYCPSVCPVDNTRIVNPLIINKIP